MIAIKGTVVTPTNAKKAVITVADGRIVGITNTTAGCDEVHDFGEALIVPGFIDTHTHGMIGYHGMTTAEILAIAEAQLRLGTTGFLPTQACLTEQQYMSFGRHIVEARDQAVGKASKVIGAHFEGPFINPKRKGGMSTEHLRPMDEALCNRYLDELGDAVKLMTLSPELADSSKVIHLLVERGVVVSLGHTIATVDEFKAGAEAGASLVCHLFNTFLTPGEAELGVWDVSLVETAMVTDALSCEIICDMHHVASTHVQLAARALGPDRFVAITDSSSAAGAPVGDYTMTDGRTFSTASGASRLTDGSETDGGLVGSVLTMNRAFGNLVEVCGLDTVLAARFTATNAARVLGLADQTGSIEPGKAADLAVLDGNYDCVATFVDGLKLHGD